MKWTKCRGIDNTFATYILFVILVILVFVEHEDVSKKPWLLNSKGTKITIKIFLNLIYSTFHSKCDAENIYI